MLMLVCMAEPIPPQGAPRTSPVIVHGHGLTPFQAPLLYFNGFTIALGSSDFTLVLNVDNAPAITLKCSYTTAKTFGDKLQMAVKQFEEITKYTLLTSDDIATAMKAQGQVEIKK